MASVVFFLEEESAKTMLQGIIDRLLTHETDVRYVVFEGKQDLEKQLGRKLKAWLDPDCLFVVMRDQDSGDCMQIKANLKAKVVAAGKPNTLIRIACHELESFYLGDLKAVAHALGPRKIASFQSNQKYRDPDRLANAAQELKRIAPSYQKIAGSRAIAPHLDLSNNSSTSFNALINGIRSLVSDN